MNPAKLIKDAHQEGLWWWYDFYAELDARPSHFIPWALWRPMETTWQEPILDALGTVRPRNHEGFNDP